MSITSDVRAYADNAIEVAVGQGKNALDAAQAGLGKLQHNVASAKAVESITPNVDALRGAIEPYLATVLAYGAQFAGRVSIGAEAAVADLKKDARIAQVIHTGEALATVVVEAVHERVSQAASVAAGASSLLRPTPARRASTSKPAPSSGAETATSSTAKKVAATKPNDARTVPAKATAAPKAPAKATAAPKAPAKATAAPKAAAKATAAPKAPAKRAPAKATAAKKAPAKATAAKKAAAKKRPAVRSTEASPRASDEAR
jgi:hypothetical protein